ncbi:MAG: hypothetical protein QM713_15920 [Arachnia sp.]
MLIPRRAVLTAAGAVALVGCTSSPVVEGEPAVPPTPPPPTQAPEVTAAVSALVALSAELTRAAGLAAWQDGDWARAAAAQCQTHAALFALPDPLAGGEQDPFPLPTPSPGTATDEKSVATGLTERARVATDALESAAAAATSPDLRLAWASAATAAYGLAGRRVTPVAGDAAPRRFASPTREAALAVALSHAWALVYGLGVGVGRLGSKDKLREWGVGRLNAAKELRNELRSALGADTPAQPAAFVLPTAMDSVATITAGWAELELNLLDGFAAAVAAEDSPRWRELMRAQTAPVARLGAPLPSWPGWVAAN